MITNNINDIFFIKNIPYTILLGNVIVLKTEKLPRIYIYNDRTVLKFLIYKEQFAVNLLQAAVNRYMREIPGYFMDRQGARRKCQLNRGCRTFHAGDGLSVHRLLRSRCR